MPVTNDVVALLFPGTAAGTGAPYCGGTPGGGGGGGG
jgi:hypothetical protein